MSLAPEHPAPLVETLERLGLQDLLVGYIDRTRVGIQFVKLEQFAQRHGYQFDREFGNIYGRLRLIPTPPSVQRPTIRLITRSDHAAVHGSKRRAA